MRLRVVANECEHSKFEKRAVSENLTDFSMMPQLTRME